MNSSAFVKDVFEVFIDIQMIMLGCLDDAEEDTARLSTTLDKVEKAVLSGYPGMA